MIELIKIDPFCACVCGLAITHNVYIGDKRAQVSLIFQQKAMKYVENSKSNDGFNSNQNNENNELR